MTKKLIIIDDSSVQLNILKNIFVSNGWDVCGVQSAKIGYEMIFDFAPDLIITDAIMPLMGGFSLIKLIRENESISKIPVIVYSVLSQQNVKFFLKEELSEYFLQKNDNQEELLELAQKAVNKTPLSESYKENILKIGLQNYKYYSGPKKENDFIEPEEIKEVEVETEIQNKEENEAQEENQEINLDEKMKEIANFSFGDEKIFTDLTDFIYENLNYDLAILEVYSYEDKRRKIYFDIKDIILSPIFKNAIINKYQTNLYSMHKKYAPNLPTIFQEKEFLSKLEFNFEYKNENIANVVFYSRKKLKWKDEEQNTSIKNMLFEFFKARYIQRTAQNSKKDESIDKYIGFQDRLEKDIKFEQDAYFAILQISNFFEISGGLEFEELDMVNSKISEKIINCLEKNEQVYRNDEDEYNIVIFAKDDKQAKRKFEYICEELEKISYNTYIIAPTVAACNCNIDNVYNIKAAQEFAREIIEGANNQEKVVIYNARK